MRAYRIAQTYDPMTLPVMPYREMANFLTKRLLSAGRKIMEVACGTGNLTVELAQQGFQVYGLDYSPEMLEVARTKTAEAGLETEFFCQDMRQPFAVGQLDAVICFYGGLNFLNSGEALQEAFASVSAALRPGGLFIFDHFSPEKARELFSGTNAADYDQFFVVTQSECDKAGQVQHRVTYFLHQPDGSYHREEEEHFIRLHPFEEIEARLQLADFELLRREKLYPELDDPFFEDSVLFVAQKR
jgi:SAM-dependent methyltransferase